MVKTNAKKNNVWALVALLVIALTFSTSSAKFVFRYEYEMQFAVAEYLAFGAGETHTFEIAYDGYYAFRLWGGSGGESKSTRLWEETVYEHGGAGGEVTAVGYFTKGTILLITVGTRGYIIEGGYNGGGSGGKDEIVFNGYFGGGGGGATDVRVDDGTPDGRILVAGGGGGGSGGSPSFPSDYGGSGGNVDSAYAGDDGVGQGAGGGGSLIAGGNGSQLGEKGKGGDAQFSGGGGGGGYYGGGGAYGSGGGGGGGSSYVGGGFVTALLALPDRAKYETDVKDGFAIVTYLGSKW